MALQGPFSEVAVFPDEIQDMERFGLCGAVVVLLYEDVDI